MNESISADSKLRHMPEHHHHACLKSVKISGFSSAKSLVEQTCHILKNAVSLECVTLDAIYGPMADGNLMETPRVLSAIRTHIQSKVPSTIELTVPEPCSQCHSDLVSDEAGSVS
jgi:hypothetical protein